MLTEVISVIIIFLFTVVVSVVPLINILFDLFIVLSECMFST